MLSCTEIRFDISFFKFENFWVKLGFPFMQLNRANTQNLGEKNNFDMFYKNYCWAVICYPICMTTVSYEREIIVLSFLVISFVILIFVCQRFEIKSGFPFFYSHCRDKLSLHYTTECVFGFSERAWYRRIADQSARSSNRANALMHMNFNMNNSYRFIESFKARKPVERESQS